jgi:hypothetical protein
MLRYPYAYIVSYGLTNLPTMYGPLIAELQQSQKWWHYLDSTWIVLRYETLFELQDRLLPLIFANDRLLIMPAKGPAGGWLPQDAWKWISDSVPNAW